MNMGQFADLVRSSIGGNRVDSLTQVNGDTIAPAAILAAIEEAF
jgi:hypothetical protein